MKKKWSDRFKELYLNTNRTLSIEEYEYCIDEYIRLHENRSAFQWILAIICFVLGLLLLAYSSVVGSVFFIAMAAYFNLNSTNHAQMADILNINRIQAMLINKYSKGAKENDRNENRA